MRISWMKVFAVLTRPKSRGKPAYSARFTRPMSDFAFRAFVKNSTAFPAKKLHLEAGEATAARNQWYSAGQRSVNPADTQI